MSSNKIMKNLVVEELKRLIVHDLPVSWVSVGETENNMKNFDHIEASLYISEFLFAKEAGVVCPNRLIGLVINIGFSVRDFTEDSHLELTDLLADFSTFLAKDRYKNLLGIGKLSVSKNPTVLAGKSQSGTKISDVMIGVIVLKFEFS
jgi:hypothetical protein